MRARTRTRFSRRLERFEQSLKFLLGMRYSLQVEEGVGDETSREKEHAMYYLYAPLHGSQPVVILSPLLRTLLTPLLGRKVQRAFDGESGRELHHFWGAWGDYQKGVFEMPGYDFRILVVE